MDIETYLEDKNLSNEEKSVIRMLYYEDRLLLEDVADLLGPMEAARSYILKDRIDSPVNKIPEPEDVSIPGDEDFYNEEIPDEVFEDDQI
jgi:hypothetical protein